MTDQPAFLTDSQTAAGRAAARKAKQEANRRRYAELRAEKAAAAVEARKAAAKASAEATVATEKAAAAEAEAPRLSKAEAMEDAVKATAAMSLLPSSHAFDAHAREAFLELYAAGLTVVWAAREIGVSPAVVFRFVRNDAAFAAQFALAREANTDHTEDALHAAALGGSVPALLAVLRNRRPTAWREGKSLDVRVDATVQEKADSVFAELVSVLARLDTAQRVPDKNTEVDEAPTLN